MRSLSRLAPAALAPLTLLGACATQPAYLPPAVTISGVWGNGPAKQQASASVSADHWWTLLGDPAVDQLVFAGLDDNPTIAEAAARVDQARALAAVHDARRLPTIGLDAGVSRQRDRSGPGGGTTSQSSAGIGAGLSWELDLWGRVRENASAARSRLAARTADADTARLAIIGDIADTALALRACNLTLDIRDRDIASREAELSVTRTRLSLGDLAPVAVAAAESNLASARTERALQEETCRRLVDALVALSGVDAANIRRLVAKGATAGAQIAEPPAFVPALPAVVLLEHPSVIAAEREVAARWSEIAVSRTERLPRIDLAAALSQQWIRALGSSASYVAGSIGAGLVAPIFDGGAGAANVHGAEADYREALARLDGAVRAAVRDIEDGLAAQQSAATRIETSAAALEAARFTLDANTARWRAGSIAQIELEDSRRQLNRAEESAIAAAADRARAWVALVRRTGGRWNAASISSPAQSGSIGMAALERKNSRP
jgi:NodT family efflux transporter outer membrane factor (OMF) lipoprotein